MPIRESASKSPPGPFPPPQASRVLNTETDETPLPGPVCPQLKRPLTKWCWKPSSYPFFTALKVAQRSLSKSTGPVPSVPEAIEDPEKRIVMQHAPFLTDSIKASLSAYSWLGYMTRQLVESRFWQHADTLLCKSHQTPCLPAMKCRALCCCLRAPFHTVLPGGIFLSAHFVCIIISVLNLAALCTELTFLTVILANVHCDRKTSALHKS